MIKIYSFPKVLASWGGFLFVLFGVFVFKLCITGIHTVVKMDGTALMCSVRRNKSSVLRKLL